MTSPWYGVIIVVATLAAGLSVGTAVFQWQGGRDNTEFNIIGALFFGFMAMLWTAVGTTALLVALTA